MTTRRSRLRAALVRLDERWAVPSDPPDPAEVDDTVVIPAPVVGRRELLIGMTALVVAGAGVRTASVRSGAAPSVASPRPVPAASMTTASATAPVVAAPDVPGRTAAPVRVEIDRIAVRSELLGLGLDDAGALEVPADPNLAGWYVHGATPGSPGPLVIAGHVDSYTGAAIFHGLRDLALEDEVTVTSADGRTHRYRVTRVAQHAKDAFPTFDVFGPTPEHTLRLITCGGTFDRDARSYRDNVVVYAVPTSPTRPPLA